MHACTHKHTHTYTHTHTHIHTCTHAHSQSHSHLSQFMLKACYSSCAHYCGWVFPINHHLVTQMSKSQKSPQGLVLCKCFCYQFIKWRFTCNTSSVFHFFPPFCHEILGSINKNKQNAIIIFITWLTHESDWMLLLWT